MTSLAKHFKEVLLTYTSGRKWNKENTSEMTRGLLNSEREKEWRTEVKHSRFDDVYSYGEEYDLCD